MNNGIIGTSLTLEHPTVQTVIEIAQDIIADNRVLNIDNLYHIARRELNIPKKGLIKIIQYLINKNIIIDGSKYTQDSVLSNDMRNTIYIFIKSNLGAHFSLIKNKLQKRLKNTSLSSGQLIWHLEMLIKFNLIKKIKIGNFSVFLPSELDIDIAMISFFLKDRINKKISLLLKERRIVEQSNIYKEINENREKVYYRINNLLEYELLEIIKEDTNKIQLSVKFKEKIINTLNLLSNQLRYKNKN